MELKKSLCFIDGEPHAYCSKNKTYIKLNLKYEDYLKKVKSEISQCKERPGMNTVWKTLAKLVPETETYSPAKKSTNTKEMENSFENRFTRDITAFLNNIFRKEDCKKVITTKYPYHYFSYGRAQIIKKKLLNQKRGKTEYFY